MYSWRIWVGIREAVLVAVLGPAYGTPALLAASVAHRLVTIAAEPIVVLGHRARLHHVGRVTSPSEPASEAPTAGTGGDGPVQPAG